VSFLDFSLGKAESTCFEPNLLTVIRRIEGAVKQILCGMNVKTSASVANAGCLEWYRQWTSDH
jgi:acetoacetyl-CoA synthetase